MYDIRILGAATRELAQLDMPAGRRIANRIRPLVPEAGARRKTGDYRWLAAKVEDIKPEALTGDLAGLCKLRVGAF